MNIRFWLLISFFACVRSLAATEFNPWLPSLYDVNVKAALLCQAYPSLSGTCGKSRKPACDGFLFLGAEGVPLEDTDIELEFIASDTRYKDFTFDAFKITGRYQWLNDITGDDPVALTTGLTISAVTKPALHDLSSFYHGRTQAEAHIAYGKEIDHRQFWISRTWAVIGLGLADVGSAWLRGNLTWEKNWCDSQRFKMFINSLWGFGKSPLNLSHHFKGYGSINHQSIDIGLGYTYVLPYKIELIADYAYRVYARNCPRCVHLFQISYIYPFSL